MKSSLKKNPSLASACEGFVYYLSKGLIAPLDSRPRAALGVFCLEAVN